MLLDIQRTKGRKRCHDGNGVWWYDGLRNTYIILDSLYVAYSLPEIPYFYAETSCSYHISLCLYVRYTYTMRLRLQVLYDVDLR